MSKEAEVLEDYNSGVPLETLKNWCYIDGKWRHYVRIVENGKETHYCDGVKVYEQEEEF